MGRPKRLKVTSKTPGAPVKAVCRTKVSEGKNTLSSQPVKLQPGIVHYLPLTSLWTICQLKYWRSVCTDKLLRGLLPITARKTEAHGTNLGEGL